LRTPRVRAAPRAWLCSVTCFESGGALDREAQRQLWRRVAEAGIGIYVGGSSPGEQYALAPDEVAELLALAVEEVGRRVPVRALGVEPRHPDAMRELIRQAEDCGVDAVQIYSLDMGHGGRPTEAELDHYFRRALDAARGPAVISSHVSVGYSVPAALLERLARDWPQLHGVNVTSPDVVYLDELCDRLGERLEICVGGAMHALTALALGGAGFLSGEAALAPATARALVERFASGDLAGAAAAHAALLRWMRAQLPVSGAYVRRIKAALMALGLSNGAVRDPFLPPSEGEVRAVAERIRALALADLR